MPAKAKISGLVVAGFPSPAEQREEPCAARSQEVELWLQGCKSAALGMDRDEHLFSRYGEWRRGKFAAGGFGAAIVRLL
jgi:hypothetical protein